MRSVVVVVALVLAACDAAQAPSLPAGPGAADVSVLTVPPGAAVVVDGVGVGLGPVTVKLNPGPHRLRATMSGYYPVQETKIVVERGVAQTQTLTLVASH